jgi:predicted porin
MMSTPGYGRVFEAGESSCATDGCVMFYRRTDQTVWYNSPNWGGFTFGAYTTTGYLKSGAPGSTNPLVWGLAGKYVVTTFPLQAWIAYENHDDLFGLLAIAGTGGIGSDDRGIQAGVGYTFGDVFLFANYERLEYESDGLAGPVVNRYERDAYSIGTKWNLASGYVGAHYIQALEADCNLADGSVCNSDGTGAWQIGLGYYHTLSKQTQAYLVGSYIDNDSNASYVLAGAGSTNAAPASAFGASHTAISIGLVHRF